MHLVKQIESFKLHVCVAYVLNKYSCAGCFRHANVSVLTWPTSVMSVEHVDNGEGDMRCPLGVATVSAHRHSGSVTPADLQHMKQEGIKPSSTEPQLSSAHVDRSADIPIRYAVLVCLGLPNMLQNR